jgi:flagellar assembly factor FliW
MKCADTLELERPATAAAAANQVRLPMGLLGFEQIKDYVLLANPAEAPFAWLQVEDNASLAFVVINPFLVAPDYQPDIPESDVEFLGLEEASDAILLNIVTIHGSQHATINLKGPIVVNRHTRIGKQVILNNAANYSVQYPLPVEETVA